MPTCGAPPKRPSRGGGLAQTPRPAHPYKSLRPTGSPGVTTPNEEGMNGTFFLLLSPRLTDVYLVPAGIEVVLEDEGGFGNLA